jgi:hypothetical protein
MGRPELTAHQPGESHRAVGLEGQPVAGAPPTELLAELPVLDKYELMANGDAIETDPRLTLERANETCPGRAGG